MKLWRKDQSLPLQIEHCLTPVRHLVYSITTSICGNVTSWNCEGNIVLRLSDIWFIVGTKWWNNSCLLKFFANKCFYLRCLQIFFTTFFKKITLHIPYHVAKVATFNPFTQQPLQSKEWVTNYFGDSLPTASEGWEGGNSFSLLVCPQCTLGGGGG